MAFVNLDLSRDLPKVRKQWAKVEKAQSTRTCQYTAPCVIGAMVPPRHRPTLEHANVDSTEISELIEEGLVTVAPGQQRDIVALQKAFDSGSRDEFLWELERVEKKYLPAQGMSPGTAETGTGSGPKDGQPGGEAMRPEPSS